MKTGSRMFEDDLELQKEMEQLALEAEKNRLGVESGEIGSNLPSGTKVVMAEEVPEAEMPKSGLRDMPTAPPKVVDLSKEPMGDMELAYARAMDRKSRGKMAFERGARELIGGLTLTKPAGVMERPTDAESKLDAQRKYADERAGKATQARLAGKKIDFDKAEAARKAEVDASRDQRDFAYRQEHDAASLAQQDRNAKAALAMSGAGLGLRVAAEKREAEKDARGKDLPASEIASLSELPEAERQVDELGAAFERLGMGGMKGKVAQKAFDATGQGFGTGVDEFDAQARLAMQAAGKIAEGGKLAAGDEVKYRRMMPQPGDSPEVVKTKVDGMKKYLRGLASRRAHAFKEARYNVPESVVPSEAPTATPARPTATNPQTGEVVEWDGSQWIPKGK